jgi:hypothetical protein
MTLVWRIFTIVSNDPGQVLHPFLEDALDVRESEVIPHFGKGTPNRVLALELSILHLLLSYAKQPKVAQTYVRRIKWVWGSFNASLGKFLGDLVPIMTHRIIRVR